MSKIIPLNARAYLAPKYWPLWLVFGLMRISALLPLRWSQAIGAGIGLLMYRLVASRRRVARINISQAYPDYTEAQVRQLNRDCFRSLGIAFFEMSLAWYAPRDYLRSITVVDGKHNLDQAMANGKGVILLTGHFTTLEIGGALICLQVRMNGVYKKAHDPFFNAMMTHHRSNWGGNDLLENNNVRGIIRGLRQGNATWYAPDQDFGDQDTVFTPFLGGMASTLTATARMAEMTGAAVVPFYQQRLENARGYKLVLMPALENFPDEDIEVASARINKAIEDMVYANPEEYGWVHKRFKHRPPGEPSLY